MPKPDRDVQPLRDGTIDLEIGTVRTSAPEMLTRLLFRDRYVGACRLDHPLSSRTGVSLERGAGFGHGLTARPGEESNPVDAALAECGKQRRICLHERAV